MHRKCRTGRRSSHPCSYEYSCTQLHRENHEESRNKEPWKPQDCSVYVVASICCAHVGIFRLHTYAAVVVLHSIYKLRCIGHRGEVVGTTVSQGCLNDKQHLTIGCHCHLPTVFSPSHFRLTHLHGLSGSANEGQKINASCTPESPSITALKPELCKQSSVP